MLIVDSNLAAIDPILAIAFYLGSIIGSFGKFLELLKRPSYDSLGTKMNKHRQG